MIEFLKILITILGCSTVSNDDATVNMINFIGEADSPYFKGTVMPGGIDRQIYFDDRGALSARYMLEGVDFMGDSCKIFIENNADPTLPYTSPSIITDSKALSFLNSTDLIGKISSEDDVLTIHIGRPLDLVPKEVFSAQPSSGKVEEFKYKAGKQQKRAMVYLPKDYNPADTDTKYDVIYLIHGGGDNASSFFCDPRSPLPLTNVLDYLIDTNQIEPVIVVCPTFYADDLNIGSNEMKDAVTATKNFHKELRKYLIPSVESHYSTNFNAKEKDAVNKSRNHRAFGGFSMGALCTWYQLAYDPDAVGVYLPLSGDLWIYDDAGNKQNAEEAALWLDSMLTKNLSQDDFQIYAYTGSEDIAYKPEDNLIKALRALHSDHFRTNNLEYGVKDHGVHYYGDINEYLYHALKRIYPNPNN